MIEDKAQKEKCRKTEIECDFSEDIEEILQCNQSEYKIMLCISLKEKKIIHQKYIMLNDKYIFSEFYVWTKQLQEKLWRYDSDQHLKKWIKEESTVYNQLWQEEKKFVWFLTSKNDQLSQQN